MINGEIWFNRKDVKLQGGVQAVLQIRGIKTFHGYTNSSPGRRAIYGMMEQI